MARTKKEASFEKDLEQLEHIVAALEAGGLSLDESLKRFEDGIRLARSCEKALGEAEKRIEILTKNAQGELQAKAFGDEEDEVDEEGDGDDEDVPPEPPEEAKGTEEDLLF